MDIVKIIALILFVGAFMYTCLKGIVGFIVCQESKHLIIGIILCIIFGYVAFGLKKKESDNMSDTGVTVHFNGVAYWFEDYTKLEALLIQNCNDATDEEVTNSIEFDIMEEK